MGCSCFMLFFAAMGFEAVITLNPRFEYASIWTR